jgi:hypothetical protein
MDETFILTFTRLGRLFCGIVLGRLRVDDDDDRNCGGGDGMDSAAGAAAAAARTTDDVLLLGLKWLRRGRSVGVGGGPRTILRPRL